MNVVAVEAQLMSLRYRLALAIVLWFAGSATAALAAPFSDADATNFLTASANRWNAGDLDGFMKSYVDSPNTLSIGASTVVHGYAAIRDLYAKHYGRHTMGRLSFGDVMVRPLGDDYAVIVARFQLVRGASRTTGLFSLVLRRTSAGWRIVVDHSA